MKKAIEKIINQFHVIELLIYGVIGGVAWITQAGTYYIAIKAHVFPSVAMIFGNFIGMVVAYFGHVRFTFKRKHRFSRVEFIKFFVTSFLGLCFNVACVRMVTKVLDLNPIYALIPTIITPFLTFLINKFWAFRV